MKTILIKNKIYFKKHAITKFTYYYILYNNHFFIHNYIFYKFKINNISINGQGKKI